jgi:hypothetical protein
MYVHYSVSSYFRSYSYRTNNSVDTASFNCDGTGTTTVTVTNPSNLNYTYEYLIDGVLNTNTADPKVFLNVPSGSHIITVKYKLVSVST